MCLLKKGRIPMIYPHSYCKNQEKKILIAYVTIKQHLQLHPSVGSLGDRVL